MATLPVRPPADPFLVISIDGGGVRGVVTAMLLQDLTRHAGLDLSRINLLAGTSAGSLTAMGLAAGVGIDRITETFRSEAACRQIFTPNDKATMTRRRGLLGVILRWIEWLARGKQKGLLGTVNHLLNPRYTGRGLKDLLDGIVKPIELEELGQWVFAPSLCLDTSEGGEPTWRPSAFHNLGHRSNEDGFAGHERATVIDAVMASSAAPVYFPPHRFGGKHFVDGGTIATNPSALALSAAIGAGLIGDAGTPLARVKVLSLGTGAANTVYPPDAEVFPPPFGVLGWMWPAARGAKKDTPAMPLLEALQDAATQAGDYQSRMLLPRGNYLRVQLELGRDHVALDDATSLPDLERRTRELMESGEWRRAREWVAANLRG
jgi:hypothetical protein